MTDKNKSIMLVGRNEGGQGLMLQAHFGLDANNKISIISQHPKPDVNQGFYVFEYNRKFTRVDTSLKLSNHENSFSAVAAAFKNVFVGFDASFSVNY
jgi:hypothetical protein